MNSKLITALVTPFNKNGAIDEDEFVKLIKDVENQGSDGIVVGGTTGEGSSLSNDELIRLISLANETSDMELIINVGLNSTHKTIELIHQIKEYKHDALMVIVPYYNKPNQKGIFEHFKEIANTFKNEKFIIYNVPSRTVVKIEENTLSDLINECPNIIGLKHASMDLDLVKQIRKKWPNFVVYSGDDKLLLDMMKCGARGVISVISHVYGKEIKELIEDYEKGIENEILNQYIKDISDTIFCDTNPISIKYALSKKGYESMNLRLPLVELDDKYKNDINIILNLD